MNSSDSQIAIQMADLETGQLTPVPGSEGLYRPRWSPDGRHLAALSRDALRLLLYDFSSQSWRPLSEGTAIAHPSWARDSASAFVSDVDRGRVRIRIADGRREIVHSFEGLRQIFRLLGPWVDHAPDDSILALRDTSIDEIFAFELETDWPRRATVGTMAGDDPLRTPPAGPGSAPRAR